MLNNLIIYSQKNTSLFLYYIHIIAYIKIAFFLLQFLIIFPFSNRFSFILNEIFFYYLIYQYYNFYVVLLYFFSSKFTILLLNYEYMKI